MASGENKSGPPQEEKVCKLFRTDPNGRYFPTPNGILWGKKTLYDQNGDVMHRSVCVPVSVPGFECSSADIEPIEDLSQKIVDTKEAEAEIARQKNQEVENHKVCMQQYEDRIQKLEEQLDQISLDIKKKDADNKSSGIVAPRPTKDLDEKQQEEFVKQFVDYYLVHKGISFDALVWKGPKEKSAAEIQYNLEVARAAGKSRLGPGVRILRGPPPTQPQKRKIDEVYVHDSDEEDLVILGEWPCEKKGTAVRKNRENCVKMYSEDDPLDGSIVQKWMNTWDQFFHPGASK